MDRISSTSLLSEKAAAFIESILRLKPEIAVFDCDGTLWSGDAGEGFFKWELNRGVLSDEVSQWVRARYADYKAGLVSEDEMCGEMVTIHRGLRETVIENLSEEFFTQHIEPQIFPEMRELVSQLHAAGTQVWAVSSTNEWVIRAGMKCFGIPAENILAAAVEIEDSIITDRLIRIPSGPGKPRAIREVIRREPDAVFGNSKWDADMLAIARNAFAVNPNPDLEEMAKRRGWTVYRPEAVASQR
ncbi:MAG: haloacid dehalogenase-like hydrolase [Acidobacteriota bacterium]|nr:haloacid dehalogenase-like hydrolase [Acidobacteriota bacterium]